ncbi:hypothetical protein ABER61_20775 [Brevibacillus formosus]|uniref:Uncharacterized protein n=1 Tax=Brevibacillus formosus TaxID=54913 RepID=A0ABQ0TBL4_9BACL|nr:hypothetical protein [Brevibacillus formosus]PSJ99143.1 hypothetical protein C7R91_04265 [Brevibacillus formosus]GED60702.1 hypothetical protein BFO01nite_48340 [Brevibacillus formosus]
MQDTVIDGELTRIEIVDKPEGRIPLAELLHHPPEQNKRYFAPVVTDWDSFPKKRAEQARQLRDGVEIEKKKDCKKALIKQPDNVYYRDFYFFGSVLRKEEIEIKGKSEMS